MIAAAYIAAGILVCLAGLTAFVCVAPLVDKDENPIDEIVDDPRPGEVLRAAWADREGWGGLS